MKDIQPYFNLDKEITGLIVVRNTAVLELGKRFRVIKNNSYFEQLGYDTFDSYVASKGSSIKTVDAYIRVYELFVEHFGYDTKFLSEIPWNRLQLIAPRVRDKTKEEADEWVYKAKELSASDLKIEVLEEKANEGHADKRSYPQLWRCGQCGKWQLPSDIPLCEGHK